MAKSSFARPGAAPGKAPAAAAPQRPAPKKPGPPTKPAPPSSSARSAAVPAKKPVAPVRRGPSAPPPGIRSNAAAAEPELDEPKPIEIEAETTYDEQQEVGGGESLEEQQETAGRELALPPAQNMFDVPVGQSAGQKEATDIEMPLMKIAQGSDSPLINEQGFADGDLVLASEAILYQDGCEPVEFTAVRMGKRFMQQLDYGKSDEFPLTFDTKEQAQEAGLVPFGGHEVGYVPIVDLTILIKQPEGVECSTFIYEHDGVRYGYAMWQIRGSAYKAVARKLFTQEKTRLRAGLHTGSFKLELRKTKGKIGTYWLPVLTNGDMHDAAFIEFAEAVGNGTADEG